MRILVVGSGGREHALAWKLAQEAEVIVAPGNPGIAQDCETVPVQAKDFEGLASLCKDRDIDLVVVGPEDPLIAGLGNHLRKAGILVYGPNADGAQLEGSKSFSKTLMREAGVPTAEFESFDDPDAASEFAKRRFAAGKGVAVKASGNALGKGVVVADTFEEAEDAIRRFMIAKEFGPAGETIVIEDRLVGPEFSLLTIVSEESYWSLPVAQDHKRAYDGDLGPNTGGMGAFSPVPWISPDLIEEVENTIVVPTLKALKERGISYRGTLFSGIMMESGKPYCLEFNVRMGDPETQAVMMRIESGYAAALLAAAKGDSIPPITISEQASLTVVVCAENYPTAGSKGAQISIGDLPAGSKLFHAGTALTDGDLVTNGGRVFAATALAPTIATAREQAYQAADAVLFEGARYRSDIGAITTPN